MADQLANAIQNAHQYEELKETKGLVGGRTALAWMGMANSTWRHSIEGYAINIRNNATMLRRNLKKLSIDETAQKPLQKNLIRIETEAARILDKPITPPLSSEEGLEVVLINDLLKERLEQLWRNDLYQDITYRLRLAKTARAKVRVSPEWIRRAFDLLVENAAQAMAKAPQKILTISTRKVQDQVKINIQDTGIGIAPEVEARLFQERIDSSKTHGGLGMGLLMVQAIIQTYGGDICIDETGLEGTTMVVSLPLMY
jgi:signal transduction histidine kinase